MASASGQAHCDCSDTGRLHSDRLQYREKTKNRVYILFQRFAFVNYEAAGDNENHQAL